MALAGIDGWDVINDHVDNPAMNAIMKEVEPLIDELESEIA